MTPCWLLEPSACRSNALSRSIEKLWAAEAAGFASAFDPKAGGPPSGGGLGWLFGMASQHVPGARAGRGAAIAAAGRSAQHGRIVDAVAALGAEVKIGRTAKNAGDFVNITFKDGTVINVRVETHPPLGFHGNVDLWRPGQNPLRKHVIPPPGN